MQIQDSSKKELKLSNFHFLILFLSCLIIQTGLSCLKSMGQGNLMVFPTRVVFEGTKKIQELNLANTSNDTAIYMISIVQMRMKDNGEFENITEPDSGQYFANKYVRIFPRKVILAPKETQVVKVQCINAENISTGEYRSHIYFRAQENQKALGEEDASKSKDTTNISVKLKIVFGISIPVIVRVGESTAQVSLSDVSFNIENDTIPALLMKFNRTGNMSVYGDIKIDYISATNEKTQAGFIKGVAVYTPNKSRWLKLNLDKKIKYDKGKFHVTYTTQDGIKLTETDFIVH